MPKPPSRSPFPEPVGPGLVLSGRLSGLRGAGSFVLAGVTARFITKRLSPVPSLCLQETCDLGSSYCWEGSEGAQPLLLTAWSSLPRPSMVGPASPEGGAYMHPAPSGMDSSDPKLLSTWWDNAWEGEAEDGGGRRAFST